MKNSKNEEPNESSRVISRRSSLQLLTTSIAVAPLASLAFGHSQAAAWSGTEEDALSRTSRRRVRHGGWAAGGTATLLPAAAYPDPFAFTERTECTPTCRMMLGPCHDDLAPERSDISEGLPGLPMRLGFCIIDEQCQPVPGASVDIWHTAVDGGYSSETSDYPDVCTDKSEAALSSRFFRGYQITDVRGVAWFKTCLPGWYASRAVHIHLRVRRNGIRGDESLVTQFAFPKDLIHSVIREHPDYSARGLPDTEIDTDIIFGAEHRQLFTFDVQRMFDGTLMAWKTVAVRSSDATELCVFGPPEEPDYDEAISSGSWPPPKP